jgi:hypothetical protein
MLTGTTDFVARNQKTLSQCELNVTCPQYVFAVLKKHDGDVTQGSRRFFLEAVVRSAAK